MDPQTAIIELHYLPSIPYFATWMYYGQLLLESKENFIKQSFRNRCRILTANKVDNLIVPVQHGNHFPIQEIRIDYSQTWVKNHWGAIQSAYGKSPFFEFYAENLNKILFKGHRFLFDLNIHLLEMLMNELKINTDICFTDRYIKIYGAEYKDLRSEINPKKTGYDLAFYKSVVYIQTFGQKFVEDLSILDLLFNEGPNAKEVIVKSISLQQNN